LKICCYNKLSNTLLNTAEWEELVTAGWNALVDTDLTGIKMAINSGVKSNNHPLLYGAGSTASKYASHY